MSDNDCKTKIKKASWKKPPGAPSRPHSAYNLFFAETRTKIKISCDGSTGGFASLGKTVASLWAELPEIEKQPYINKAKECRDKYWVLMNEWKKTKEYIDVVNARKERKRLARVQRRTLNNMNQIRDPIQNVKAELSHDIPVYDQFGNLLTLMSIDDDEMQVFDLNHLDCTPIEYCYEVSVADGDYSFDTSSWNDSWNDSTEPELSQKTLDCTMSSSCDSRVVSFSIAKQCHLPLKEITFDSLNQEYNMSSMWQQPTEYIPQLWWDESAIWNAYFPSSSSSSSSKSMQFDDNASFDTTL
jgi:HMG (high mobility group) box